MRFVNRGALGAQLSLAALPKMWWQSCTPVSVRVLRALAGAGVFSVALASCGGLGGRSSGPAPTTAPTPVATSPSPTVANPTILPPATTASAVGICYQPLTYGVDGGTGNDTCANGAVNVLAWDYYRKGYSAILSLGAYASPQQVQTVLNTFGPVTPDVTCEAYNLAKAYYGWQWSVPISLAGQPC